MNRPIGGGRKSKKSLGFKRVSFFLETGIGGVTGLQQRSTFFDDEGSMIA
jgi:hypothetical protein